MTQMTHKVKTIHDQTSEDKSYSNTQRRTESELVHVGPVCVVKKQEVEGASFIVTTG